MYEPHSDSNADKELHKKAQTSPTHHVSPIERQKPNQLTTQMGQQQSGTRTGTPPAQELVLFDLVSQNDLRFSPFCWRAKAALIYKGIPFR